jgi:hypothetical protein
MKWIISLQALQTLILNVEIPYTTQLIKTNPKRHKLKIVLCPVKTLSLLLKTLPRLTQLHGYILPNIREEIIPILYKRKGIKKKERLLNLTSEAIITLMWKLVRLV